GAAMALPASPISFIGRSAERDRAARPWPVTRVFALVGPGGIGKTALMRRIVEDNGGASPAWSVTARTEADLLDGVEQALGLPAVATSRTDRARRIADAIARTDGILCIDDVHLSNEASAGSLRDIAQRIHRGHLLVTSRQRVEAHAAAIEVGPLSIGEA